MVQKPVILKSGATPWVTGPRKVDGVNVDVRLTSGARQKEQEAFESGEVVHDPPGVQPFIPIIYRGRYTDEPAGSTTLGLGGKAGIVMSMDKDETTDLRGFALAHELGHFMGLWTTDLIATATCQACKKDSTQCGGEVKQCTWLDRTGKPRDYPFCIQDPLYLPSDHEKYGHSSERPSLMYPVAEGAVHISAEEMSALFRFKIDGGFKNACDAAIQ